MAYEAYEKQTWVDNVTPINADRLGHIEDGIYENSKRTAYIDYGDEVDIDDVISLISSGTNVVLRYDDDGNAISSSSVMVQRFPNKQVVFTLYTDSGFVVKRMVVRLLNDSDWSMEEKYLGTGVRLSADNIEGVTYDDIVTCVENGLPSFCETTRAADPSGSGAEGNAIYQLVWYGVTRDGDETPYRAVFADAFDQTQTVVYVAQGPASPLTLMPK